MVRKKIFSSIGWTIVLLIVFSVVGLIITPGMVLYIILYSTFGKFGPNSFIDVYIYSAFLSAILLIFYSIRTKNFKKGVFCYFFTIILIEIILIIDVFWINFKPSIFTAILDSIASPISSSRSLPEMFNEVVGFKWYFLIYLAAYLIIPLFVNVSTGARCPRCHSKKILEVGRKIISQNYLAETKLGERDKRYKENPLISDIEVDLVCKKCQHEWTEGRIYNIPDGVKSF